MRIAKLSIQEMKRTADLLFHVFIGSENSTRALFPFLKDVFRKECGADVETPSQLHVRRSSLGLIAQQLGIG